MRLVQQRYIACRKQARHSGISAKPAATGFGNARHVRRRKRQPLVFSDLGRPRGTRTYASLKTGHVYIAAQRRGKTQMCLNLLPRNQIQ